MSELWLVYRNHEDRLDIVRALPTREGAVAFVERVAPTPRVSYEYADTIVWDDPDDPDRDGWFVDRFDVGHG